MEGKKITVEALLILGICVGIFLPQFSIHQKLKDENNEIKKKIFLLERNNEELTKEIEKLQKDPMYLERKAREKLGIIKKGEYIYKKNQEPPAPVKAK